MGRQHGSRRGPDEDRVVELLGEDAAILPDQTRDDTPAGWGEVPESNDERLRRERPPHWD